MKSMKMPSQAASLLLFLFLAVASHAHVNSRSTLLAKLLERRGSNDDGYHRRLADSNQLENRAQTSARPNVDAYKFLERFGYLQQLQSGQSHDFASTKKAIQKFQQMYNLKETGDLNAETMQAMLAPRCGMGDTRPATYTEPDTIDVQRRFFTPGYKWHKTDLTYRFRNFASTASLSQDTQKRAIERAFKMWSDVSPLTFRETADPRGDFNLEFVVAAHSDGAQNAFDGPGGVLAHAFYPESGEAHFDDHEPWVDRKTEGIDLMTVAAHELGHGLGLGHSPVPGALMAPYYQGYDPEFVLTDDDIAAIQSLYGPKPNGGVQPPKTQKPTPAPTTTTKTTTTPAPVVTVPGGQPDSCSVIFRAITQIHDNSIFIFNGPWLWRLTGEGLEDGYPIRTRALYQSAPTNVDAAIYSRTTHYTFIFHGSMVWQYHGFELITSRNIGTQSFTGPITDVVTDANGNMFLIKGTDQCWLFNEYDLAVMSPSRPCSQLFPNLLNTPIDSTLQLVDEPQYIYLFRGKNYFKYNIAAKRIEGGYPKAKAGPWMGVACKGAPYSPK